MRGVGIWVAALLLTPSLSGCLTYKWNVTGGGAAPAEVLSQEAGVTIRAEKPPHHFVVHNHSDRVVYVSPQRSVVEYDGRSHALVSGKTRVIHTDLQQPDLPIAPGSSTEVSLFEPDENKMFRAGTDLRFRIAVHDGSGSLVHVPIEIKLQSEFDRFRVVTTEAAEGDRTACYITAIIYGGWCWFVKPGAEEREEAERKARQLYGPDVTVNYAGRQ